ncbi:MAG: enoyl-CoA hydratase/isomerase family protein, partial [Rhizobacter sp.]|nr:enoyl-CoA hydratase/isomerase family protein [Chlorobiales bacterium]
MPDTTVLTSLDGGVFTITLNRPEAYNAFNTALLKDLAEALKQAEKSKDARAIVLTGNGKAFCAGQDLKEVKDFSNGFSFSETVVNGYNPVIVKLATISKPVIAAINGAAAGAGFSLALACDLRVMSASAKLSTAFIKIGLVPDSGASFFLPRLIGHSRAFELMTLSDDILPEHALSIGLVNRVVPADALMTEAMNIAKRYAE